MESNKFGLPLLSILVATYNRADYLRVSLKCLKAQDYKGDWEIVIADDGSTDHTAEVISEARSDSRRLKIHHCWHEHQNYRRAFILNQASRAASGDILIFLDSDCIPASNLLSTYGAHAASNSFYLGGVYYLTEEFTRAALQKKEELLPPEFWANAAKPQNLKKGTATRAFKRYWKSRFYSTFKVRRPKIWGGNCAVNRDVFKKINGYDESYGGYSKSDSDIRNRLIKGSYRPVALHTKARTYHLYHSVEKWRTVPQITDLNNHPYFKNPNPEVVCRNGLRKL